MSKQIEIDGGGLTLAQLGRALRELAAAIEGGDAVLDGPHNSRWHGQEAEFGFSNTRPDPTTAELQGAASA